MIRVMKRAKTLVIYVFLFHIVRILADLFLPNAHIFNLIRGAVIGPFLADRGRGLAIASGVIINGAWNLRVGQNVYIAHNCWLNATGGLVIEAGAILSPNVVVATTAHRREHSAVSLRQSNQSPVFIGSGAWVASNSVVTRGAHIGEGAVIAAGSVVGGTVPPRSLYRGNPASLVKVFDDV